MPRVSRREDGQSILTHGPDVHLRVAATFGQHKVPNSIQNCISLMRRPHLKTDLATPVVALLRHGTCTTRRDCGGPALHFGRTEIQGKA
jgi:hypothetical protein